MTEATPNENDAPQVDAPESVDKRYELDEDGSAIYVDEDGNTCRVDRHGSVYKVEGDVYDSVVALVSLFPDKF